MKIIHRISLFSLLFVFMQINLFAQDNSIFGPKDGVYTDEVSTPIILDLAKGSTFLEDFNGDNTTAGITGRDWVWVDADGGGTSSTFNGNTAAFTAFEGPDNGYIGQNFQGANGLLIDQWLISPELTVEAGDTLSFYWRAAGGAWDDSVYIKISEGGSAVGDFTLNVGRYKVPAGAWTNYTYVFATGGTKRVAFHYYHADANTHSNYWGLDYFQVISGSTIPFLTIAEAIEDLNGDLIPDRLGDTVTVQGIVISPNYQTSNHSHYVWDGTAGITEIMFGTTTPVWNLGDEVVITGEIGHFRGLTQIVPASVDDVATISTGNPVPDPVILTVADYMADPEAYEGTLVAFAYMTKVAGTWPASGSATLQFTDGTDTVDIRIDSDTNIDGQPEPTYPVDIIGIGSQFSSGTTVLDDGYQILPRYYETDFLPGGTVPVELVSFNAAVSDNGVKLSWATATEINNSGFEIERSVDNNAFQKISFVGGHGTTSETSTYSYFDASVNTGKYYYRLKQIDYDGTFAYSNSVMVDVNLVQSYQLAQNFPNPFNPSTTINFSLPVEAKVTIKIYNLLGKEVEAAVNSKLAAGQHSLDLDLGTLSSGIYFYSFEAFGVDGSLFRSTKKMTLMK
jgi:hypothetical protein